MNEFTPQWNMQNTDQQIDAFDGRNPNSRGPRSAQIWSNNVATPPLTPKTSRRHQVLQQTNQLQATTIQSENESYPCKCSPAEVQQISITDQNQQLAYGNYDIPKATRCSQAAASTMQLYDTPKNVAVKFMGPYANYDVPHPGEAPVPVFRKACGCLMKLVPVSTNGCSGAVRAPNGQVEHDMMWSCVSKNPMVKEDANGHIPKLRLTGSGKMPVMDMRKLESHDTVIQGGLMHPPVAGLPPKSPVYAVVNKVNKKKVKPPEKPFHNYCNVDPAINHTIEPMRQAPTSPYYENSGQVLSRLRRMEAEEAADFPNYVEMDPVDHHNSLPPISPHQADTINQRLRKMANCLDDPAVSGNFTYQENNPLDNFQNFKTELTATLPHRHGQVQDPPEETKTIPQIENFVTMPRTAKNTSQPAVTLRRSSSVPCKSITAATRGSTSSSDDSGFSTGSPNTSATVLHHRQN